MPPVVAVPVVDYNDVTITWSSVSVGQFFDVYLQLDGIDTRLFEQRLNSTQTSISFTGLDLSSTYRFFIVTGFGEASSIPAQKSFETPEGLSPPTFESINLVEDVTSNSITVRWVLSETSPATGFRLNVTEEISGALIRQLSPSIGDRSFTSDTLSPTTRYCFSIASHIGEEVSEVRTVTQYTAPEAPTDLSITTDSDVYTNAQLTWSAPTNGSVDSYLVSTTPEVEVTVDNESRTASIVGLVPGRNYSFTVTSVFQRIESAGAVLTHVLPVTTTPVVPTTSPETTTDVTPAPVVCSGFEVALNGTCVRTSRFELTITFNLTFNESLTNSSSTGYLEFLALYNQLVKQILGTLNLSYVNIDSVTLSSGSVIATSDVEVVNDDSFTTTDDVISNINETFVNDLATSDLAVSINAVAVGAKAIDECSSSDARSTCNSTFAQCSNTDTFPNFACSCKDGYTDLDTSNPGTNCELTPVVITTAPDATPVITTTAPLRCPDGFRDRDPENPGTECEDQCLLDGADYCQNGATCAG